MNTLPRRLGAMVMFGFSIAAVAAPVFALADGTGRRFAVSGSLQPQHATAVVFGRAFTAQTRLGKSAESSMLHDGRYAVGARLVATPLACASDLIFKNGFDVVP